MRTSDEPGHGLAEPIDVTPLVRPRAGPEAAAARRAVGESIGRACREIGFFTICGHGIDPGLRAELLRTAREFFSLTDEEKAAVEMSRGGRAWRGWFGLGGELTSGSPDLKEGYYFGTDLSPDDPAVRAGRLLHGPNLYPARPPELRHVVDRWMAEVSALGSAVLCGMALGLGLEEDFFDRWCAEPTVLFRMFHYPARPSGPVGPDAAEGSGPSSETRRHPGPGGSGEHWGVGEHTDYGLLTLLAGDGSGGLEVRVDDRWVEAPSDPDLFVCNLGDMLERATGGRYRSTAHRVLVPEKDRYSFPLFLDPGWDVVVEPIPGLEPDDDLRRRSRAGRWDGADVLSPTARTYGEYLTEKVTAVFPDLAASLRSTQRRSGEEDR